MARITGILKDGMGKPIINCKIKLTALRTSATVIAHTVASQSPSEAGLYDMDVEPGHYRVTLGVSGYQPEYVGDIQVYHDSPSGTLNYFLGLPLDGDLRPDVMKEFEVMVAKVAAQASEVEKYKNSAADSAKAAQASQQAAHSSESSVSESAAAASASQKAAAASERAALSSASAAKASQQAASNAEKAAANSAAAAKVAEGNAASSKNAAATSAATASSKANEAASSASSASSSKEAAKAAETNAASSASESSRSATVARESANASRASADAASVAEKSAQSAKNDAVRKASEASSSASTASLKAQESAANAATSAQNKNAATSAATRAESAAGRAEQIAAGLSLKDASVTVKGIVQLNSSTNSTSESTAATPKAVKAAYDLAASKASTNSPIFSGTPTAPTPSSSAKGRELATAEFVAGKIAALIGSALGVMDTLQEIAAALNNNPNFANEIIRQLSGKQPLNATLTELSGKSVAQILEYLGLRETINKATGALQRSGGTVSGDINFDRDTWIGWNRNTDYAKIGFKNESDSDTDSYLWFEVGDNGNEYFKWRRNRGGPKSDLMNLKEDGLSVFVDAYFKSLGIDSQSGSWISMRDHRSVFTRNAVADNSAQAILRQDHSDKKFFVGGLGGQQFGFYMIKDDRTSNGYDAGAFLTKGGDWCCNGKIIPTNYSNFDERYVRDIRLSTREGSQVWRGPGYGDQPPYVITGVLNSNRDDLPDTIYRRALQKFINGTWYNVGGL
ncbi:prophage tail fiber N-terminal domain-containing protein [Edwardsiella tarda]